MKFIRPISDLRNKFAEISETVLKTKRPVFLTKNGYGHMVVMSIEEYEKLHFESEVYSKLKEAEQDAKKNSKTYNSREVIKRLKHSVSGDSDV